MVVKDIKILFDGYFELDMGMLVYGKTPYYGKKYQAALKPLLVQTDSDNILIDTGMGVLPESYQPYYKLNRGPGEELADSLKLMNLSVDEISMVINTHLHVDHCGNNRLFKNARFVVQSKELEYAYNPHRFQKGGYIKDMFDGIKYDTIDGNFEILPGIESILTSGHTPGHQSILIDGTKTKLGRRFVYCGDEAPLEENLKKKNITGILYNQVNSLKALETLKKLDAKYIYSHDNSQLSL
jgi:glyoxylase-like metal-dependent hydrolase (beta-lactamase superfamily II)